MNRGLFHRIVTLLLVLFCSMPALGQFTRDKAANKKIDEAINTHYFATEFQKAEDILLGTIQACGEKCSPQTLARAWMYVGVVRGSGKQDMAGAKEAFNTALALDPNVKLDQDISSPETKEAFANAGGTGGGGAPPPPAGGGGEEEPAVDSDIAAIEAAAAVPGEMLCTPEVREVQTNRTIPVSCTSAQEPAGVELRYKEFGNDKWVKVGMAKRGEGFWQAEIPCTATSAAGTLRWYVEARSATGDAIDNYGTEKEPVVMSIAEDSLAEPPAYPNQAAPARCGAGGAITAEECPPDFPGCGEGGGGGGECGYKEWGASCENSSECKCGLLCMEGSCDTAPSCDSDADCPVGTCIDGTCGVAQSGGDEGFYKKMWFGVHAAYDLGVVGGQDVCYSETQDQGRFVCYEAGSSNPYPSANQIRQGTPDDMDNPVVYPEEPYIGTGVASGVAPGTIRALLSFDYALMSSVTVGVRAGYAFLGGNPLDFFPFHGEARLTYHISGLGAGFGPYVGLSGGLAQYDLKVPATIRNCNPWDLPVERENEPAPEGFPSYEACFNAGSPNQRLLTQEEKEQLSVVNVDVYQKNGNAFVGGHVGIIYRFTDSIGAQLNANLVYTVPNSTLIIEPTLGLVYGM